MKICVIVLVYWNTKYSKKNNIINSNIGIFSLIKLLSDIDAIRKEYPYYDKNVDWGMRRFYNFES